MTKEEDMKRDEGRVLAVGQWLGTHNQITALRWCGCQWVAADRCGFLHLQADVPDGLWTADEKTSGTVLHREHPRTPWPAPELALFSSLSAAERNER